jgi:hypothetical protein
MVGALFGQRQTDQAPTMTGHEVDRFGCHLLCRNYQVPFIFTIFIIDQDNHLPLAKVRQS